jgi:GH24 family phage-related lysozyme (muramidase)
MEGRGAASFKWSALIQMLNGTQTLAACQTRTQDDRRWVVQAGVPPRPNLALRVKRRTSWP